MKKILLFFVIALLVGCAKDYTSDFNAIDERLDKLEQAVPSIEEQIESINTQLTSLKATDDAIKEQIAELEKSDKATATEIANLKKKDSALEKSISDLQNYVDTQITNAKSEAAAAYATIEQYNTIVAQLNALQNSTNKLGEDLTAKINAEVKSLTDKIADLEARLKAVEDKVENLLARIQSVSYIPTYEDGKATVKYLNKISQVSLDFEITPKDAVAELAKVWEDAVSLKAVYTQTRAVSFVDMPIVAFEADAENGVITVTASGENLSAEFFNGAQTASVRLAISDGNNSVTSEYTSMIAAAATSISEFVVPIDEIWYTSTDDTVVEPYKAEVFGANIVSNTYEDGQGIILFDSSITSIGAAAFSGCTSLTSVIIPNSVTSIGNSAFYRCLNLSSITVPDSVISIGNYAFEHCKLASITIPNSVTSIGDVAFFRCNSLTSVTIPDSVTKIGEGVFSSCDKLEYFYGKFASNDNRCLIVDNTLNTYAAGSTLVSYTIPEHITIIGGNAFEYNSYIASITIPEGITLIENHAFYGCSSLKEVYCTPTTPPTGKSYMFKYNASDRKIYVPRNSVEAYKTAEYWSDYADYIVGYDF